MKPILEVAKQETITVPDPEALVVISKMRQLLNQLALILLRETSAPTLVAESTSIMTVEI